MNMKELNLSNILVKKRKEKGITQDQLAAYIGVSKASVSKWETGKNYPDVKSLLLLSTLFHISLDTLVKGDLEEMREQIKAEDIKKWNRDSLIFGLLLVATAVLAVPLSLYGDVVGIVIWLMIFGCAIYYAGRVEKQKKTHDIQTYKEIMAFTEGKKLDEIEKYRESGKRPYQKLLLAVCAGLLTLAVSAVMIFLLR